MDYTSCWYLSVCNKAPEECSSSCLRFTEMKTLLELSNLPEGRWFPQSLVPGSDIEVFRQLKQIKDDVVNWVNEGNNIYLYSDNFGNGKTSWAVKIMLAYFNKIWPGNGFRRRGLFLSVPEFIDRHREIINNRDDAFVKMREDLIKCDLVIWDDISSTKLTDYNHSLLLNYLDARSFAKKANIFTGNVDEEGLKHFLGGRISSRVWNASTVFQFVDHDKRGMRV